MKWTKRVFGLMSVLAGTLPPHVMYAKSEDGNFWDLQLFAITLVAAITSFLTFAACRLVVGGAVKRFVIGAMASYAVILVLLLVVARMTGDFAEAMMCMPIILLFGIPFMAPLVGMSWLGSVFVFGNEKRKPEPASPPYLEPAARSPQG